MEKKEMNATNDQTTYICLFHAHNQAEAAVQDLTEAGIPKTSIGVMSNSGGSGTSAANPAAMDKWRIPERDAKHLMDQINKGGIVVAVAGRGEMESKIESIFHKHQAKQIDETGAAATVADSRQAAKAPFANDKGVINVVEEDISVGKRRVQTGGVRIFSRVVETPVNESVSLQEEHVKVDHHAVNRPLTAADGDLFREKSLQMTESGEEAVVSKTARVVEEVSVGKETTQHTERIQDTVRHTEVDVEQLGSDASRNVKAKK